MRGSGLDWIGLKKKRDTYVYYWYRHERTNEYMNNHATMASNKQEPSWKSVFQKQVNLSSSIYRRSNICVEYQATMNRFIEQTSVRAFILSIQSWVILILIEQTCERVGYIRSIIYLFIILLHHRRLLSLNWYRRVIKLIESAGVTNSQLAPLYPLCAIIIAYICTYVPSVKARSSKVVDASASRRLLRSTSSSGGPNDHFDGITFTTVRRLSRSTSSDLNRRMDERVS